MEISPVIAIHGVGNHPPGEIKTALADRFLLASVSPEPEIVEFNWDSYVDHSVSRTRDAMALLSTAAQSISQAAAQPLKPSPRKLDRALFHLEQAVYHGILRFLGAFGLTILIVAPIAQLMALLPTLLFAGMSWHNLYWLRTAIEWELLATVGVIVGMFFLSLLRSVATLSPRPLWVSVRRVALLLLQPLFLLLTIPFSGEFGSQLAAWIAKMVPMAAVSVLLSVPLSPLWGGFNDNLSSLGQSAAFLGGLAILAGLHVLLRSLWVGGILKIILDVARYMGSPAYRKRLQEELEKTLNILRQSTRSRRVLLCTHSLGSVIAMDSLVNSPVWGPDDEVYLVSFGSPIKRLFLRFFPGYLFPDSVRSTAEAAARRVRAFFWINISRRWDYVGTSLGLKRLNLGVDLSTGQAGRIFSSHSDYWQDDVVFQKLMEGLESASPVPGPRTAPSATAYSLPDTYANTMQYRFAFGAQRIALSLVPVILAVAIYNLVESRSAWLKSRNEAVAVLKQEGEHAFAEVTYYRTAEGSGEESYYAHHFQFRLPEPYGRLPEIEAADNNLLTKDAPPFDYKALTKYILENCKRAEEKRWWQIFRSNLSIPCVRGDIPIRFDAQNPESFWLPGFPSKRTAGSAVLDVIGFAILAFFFAVACFFVVALGGVLLFRLFLGLEA